MSYVVTWVIDLEADSADEAAILARDIQLDPDSMATVFEVTDEAGETHEIDVADL